MQNSGDAALAAAVDANERYLVHKLEVDWNRNGLYNHALSDLTSVVKSMQIDRDINSSLPAETTIVEGYMASQMSVTLGGTRPGDTESIARRLSPWNTAAPLFGDGRLVTPIRASIGHRVASGAETLITQFTGVLSDFSVDSRTGQVDLKCLDRSDTLRASISLPLWSLEQGEAGDTRSNWRVNSQWVIDHVLRKNGLYMSPPTHAKAIYSATMHGSLIPEVGHMSFIDTSTTYVSGRGVITSETPVYQPGRPGWGLGYGPNSGQAFVASYARGQGGFSPRSGSQISFQAQINFDQLVPPSGASGIWAFYASGHQSTAGTGNCIINRVLSTGQLTTEFRNGGSGFTTILGPIIAPGSGWQNVWTEITFGTPLSNSTIRYPGLTATIDLSALDVSGSYPASEIWAFPSIMVLAPFPMHDLQICNSTGLAPGSTLYDPTTWVPQVDLDPGLNEISGLPIRRGVDSWELLKEVSGAEFGVVGFDESGRFFFKNRDTVRRQNLVVEKTLTQDKQLSDITLSERTGSVRNVVTAKIVPRLVTPWVNAAGDNGVWDFIFKLVDANGIVCGPGASGHVIQLDFPAVCREFRTVDSVQVSASSWPPAAGVVPDSTPRFAAVRQHDFVEQTGIILSIVTLPENYGYDRLSLQVFNPGVYPIIFANTDGDPALWIVGRKYGPGTETNFSVQRASSIARYGPRTLELPDNEWRQQEWSVGAVARSVLKDLRTPVPTVQRLTAVGDCRLQLQDTTEIEDNGVLGGPMYTTVTGISRQFTADPSTGSAKLIDSLSVRPFAAPGKWILGHPVWGTLGQTTKL
jgi:hypothetical protein